jgi:DNA-binding Lrp family transcriptional regulator
MGILMAVQNRVLDEMDLGILRMLQDNCRIRIGAIAKKLNIPKSTVSYRIRRMEASGVIQGYNARINPTKLGIDYTAIVLVRAKFGPGYHEEVGKMLSQIPGVYGVYFILGDNDFIILCQSKNREAFLEKLERMYNMREIERTSSILVMKIIKEDMRVELG